MEGRYSDERRILRAQVGERVKTELGLRDLTQEAFAKIIQKTLRLAESTSRTYLSSILTGKNPSVFSSLGKGIRFGKSELGRISRVLEYFEVPLNDPLIQRLSSSYQTRGSFRYLDRAELPFDGRGRGKKA